MSDKPPVGTIGWIDLTVDDAGATSSFYSQVTGWHRSEAPVADYHDYCVHPAADADPVAGICHAKGPNAGLPASWLIYIVVENLQQSLATCRELGGEVLQERDPDGYGTIAVIRDPAGAVCALFQPA